MEDFQKQIHEAQEIRKANILSGFSNANDLVKAKDEIKKDMSAGDSTGTDTTNQATSGASLKKESLFGKKKKKSEDDEDEETEIKDKK
jgi:hypothetical protein